MAHALALDTRQVALDLHALLRDLDPARWRDERVQAVSVRLSNIQGQLHSLLAGSWSEGFGALRQALQHLSELLNQLAPTQHSKAAWMALRAHVQPAYEALAAHLDALSIHVPSLRPTNYTRNLFHLAMAVSVVLLIEHLLTPTTMILVSGAGLLGAIVMETSRRLDGRVNRALMWLFGPVAHPHEAHRVNSASWYTGALFVLALLASPRIGALAVIVLGAGDPAAATIGRRFGRIPLIHGRTLEGSAAFVIAGTAAGWLLLSLYYPGTPPGVALVIAGAGAGLGAVGELLAKRVDDNLAVPLAAALGAGLMAAALGA